MAVKLYRANDMAKIATAKCEGCGMCCRGMGDSIHLDPYDIYQITKATGKSFREMLEHEIFLRIEDGLILPTIMMSEAANSCSFLDEAGKCTIHTSRPGFCRLYPLGRQYEEDGLRYFILGEEGCPETGKKTVRIRKYLGIENYPAYEKFTIAWHNFVKGMQEYALNVMEEEQVNDPTALPVLQQVNTFLVREFFDKPYDPDKDFYVQFEERIERVRALFGA